MGETNMKNATCRLASVCMIVLVCWVGLAAQDLSPVGYWRTIDDVSGDVKSIVKIWVEDGELKGKIEKTFPKPGEPENKKCVKCKGKFKDQPILGMVFLWGFSEKTESQWINGKVLDPNNGKIYNCKLDVIENGKKLKLFGYIKLLVKIGRSQVWERTTVEEIGQ